MDSFALVAVRALVGHKEFANIWVGYLRLDDVEKLAGLRGEFALVLEKEHTWLHFAAILVLIFLFIILNQLVLTGLLHVELVIWLFDLLLCRLGLGLDWRRWDMYLILRLGFSLVMIPSVVFEFFVHGNVFRRIVLLFERWPAIIGVLRLTLVRPVILALVGSLSLIISAVKLPMIRLLALHVVLLRTFVLTLVLARHLRSAELLLRL